MLPKQKTEKNPNEKCKKSLIPNSVLNKNILDSKINYKSNTNKSANKYNIKRIKNNSLAYFANKNKINKKEEKNKVNVLNINLVQIPENKRNISDKKNKILNRVNNSKNQDNLFNICQLTHLLRNANLKQTIIIDNEGNNNLDLIMNENKKFSEETIKNGKAELKDENIIKNKLLNQLIDSKNQINLKNDNNKKQNRLNNINNKINSINNNYEKNEDSYSKNNDKDIKRLNEYNQIFQLLNENIEQFKNIIKKKDSIIDLKENKKSNLNFNRNDKINGKMKFIFTSNKEDELFNSKNNNKNNNNIAHDINANNSLNKSYSHNLSKDKNSEIYSFIDSFTQDDLFLPYNIRHQKNSSKSLSNLLKIENKNMVTTKIKKKDIERFSSNETTNKYYDDEEMQMEFSDIDEQIKCNRLKNRDINPHFFSYDFVNNINNKAGNKINSEKDCIIF